MQLKIYSAGDTLAASNSHSSFSKVQFSNSGGTLNIVDTEEEKGG